MDVGYIIYTSLCRKKKQCLIFIRFEYSFLYTYMVRYTNVIVLYGVRVIVRIHWCIGRISTAWSFTAAKKKRIHILYKFHVGEYGYRVPAARIRIFRDRNFPPDHPITHALCIQNAFLYVLSCAYGVRSHKTEVLISVRAP